ncbi:unnamed protein product [Diamesa serratosioi]
MKSLLILFICLIIIVDCDNKIIKFIDKFAGVKFDKVGKMQLIQEYAALTFDINLNDLQFAVDVLNPIFELFIIENKDNSLVFHKLWNKRRSLIKLNDELRETWKNSPKVHRVKGRFIVSIENAELKNNYKSLFNFLITENIFNKNMKTEDLWSMLEVLKTLVVRLKRTYGMIVNRTLDETVISSDVIEKGLHAIEVKLENQNLQIPLAELTAQHVSKSKFKLESNGVSLQLSMYIPLISSERIYDLYDIEQIPVLIPELNGSIQTTFAYRFLAHSNDGVITVYENVDKCMKSDNYYCEAENPIYFAAFNDCLINSFRNKILDVKLCLNDIIFTSGDDFIVRPKQHGGWWFSMQSPEKFILNCTDDTKQETFNIDGSGIILIDKQCDIQIRDMLLLSRNFRHGTENPNELYLKYDSKLIEDIKKQSENIKFYGRLSTITSVRQQITHLINLLQTERQFSEFKKEIGAVCIMLIIVFFTIGFYVNKLFKSNRVNSAEFVKK